MLLGDGSGVGLNVGLNRNAEVMIKEFINKVGDMSDDVQSFIIVPNNSSILNLSSLRSISAGQEFKSYLLSMMHLLNIMISSFQRRKQIKLRRIRDQGD